VWRTGACSGLPGGLVAAAGIWLCAAWCYSSTAPCCSKHLQCTHPWSVLATPGSGLRVCGVRGYAQPGGTRVAHVLGCSSMVCWPWVWRGWSPWLVQGRNEEVSLSVPRQQQHKHWRCRQVSCKHQAVGAHLHGIMRHGRFLCGARCPYSFQAACDGVSCAVAAERESVLPLVAGVPGALAQPLCHLLKDVAAAATTAWLCLACRLAVWLLPVLIMCRGVLVVACAAGTGTALC
jgi:hypothetical protein